MVAATERHVGAPMRRLEDRRYLIGSASYVGDLTQSGMLHAVFVRSPHAHARIRGIDAAPARRAPGVVAVWTAEEANAATAPLRIAPPIEGLHPTEMTTLPRDKVRFVGDPVACVVGTDRYLAEDAAELVQVEYDPLPPVVTADDAMREGAPVVDESLPSNVVCRQRFEYGDLARAFAVADHVVAARFSQGRQTHTPLEPRGCLAHWNPGDLSITLWSGNQVPHPLRTALAARLGVPENRARVISPDVGGAFGQKIPLFREELTVCALSRALGRPIKWIEDRRENLLASTHAREDLVEVRLAVAQDGTILGVEASILADFGAYCLYPANYMARVIGMMIPGPYRFQNYAYELQTVLTNKCPAAPYRAPMNVCAWVSEGMVEAVARQLGLDPVAVRRRNMVRAEDQPFTSASGQVYEAITPLETTERALALVDYDRFRREQRTGREQGRLLGLGLCTYVEPTAYGSAFYRSAGIAGSGHDVALVRIEPSGAVNVQVGVPSQGQGHATTVAQVVADELGIRPTDVVVASGDTASAPYGMGTRGTRGAVVTAGSSLAAARRLRDKIARIAAHLLEVAPEDLELGDGRITVRGAPGPGLTLRDVALKAYLAPMELPSGVEPGLEAYGAYDPPPLTFSNASHICLVEVDPETGQLRILRYVIVEDCGTIVNPLVVEGQTHGGTAQGLGGAMLEHVVYDGEGQNLSATLMDYLLPTAVETPSFEIDHLGTPNPHTPLGIKGTSEGGTMGGSAAVCNAVADALAPLGLVVDRQPLSPDYLRGLIHRTPRPPSLRGKGSGVRSLRALGGKVHPLCYHSPPARRCAVAITRLEIRSRQPYAEGTAFGDVGPYERLDGTVHVAVDPGAEANRSIVDLDKAERDSEGRVHFRADFCLLQPTDPERGNRRLLFEVLNRGRKLLPRMVNHAPVQPPTEGIDPGDGFLMRHGWTIAWCGWQWDVVQSPALMGLEAPTALENGRPIQGQVAIEFQPNEPIRDKLLANRVHEPYPAADLNDTAAELTVRDWPDGPRTTIPRDRWRFARDHEGRPQPADTHVWLGDGFAPGKVYEVVYRTRICPVVGTGLLAVRDTVAFLRHGDVADGNPCAGRIDQAYGFGMSQSGRFLRHFLYLGLNLDEAGRQVFDAVIPHVAGARRGQFNQRFGQPSDQSTPGFGHLWPFTDDDQTDPLTGQTDGLLRRQRELGGVPKIFTINTSAEYWRGDSSLVHTDLAGERDVEPPPEARVYLFAGTQHGLGVVPLIDFNEGDGCRGANGFNAVDYAPLLRAALVNLDRWVTAGVEPPPSAFPRLADGTAAHARDVLDTYRDLPESNVPAPECLPRIQRLDLGPEAAQGVGRYPAVVGEAYPNYVSAVDRDGVELAGIRLPDLTVPVATYTGWNPRHPETGGEGQAIPMQGSTFPLARTLEDRMLANDPRHAVGERYRDRDDYLAQVRAAADRLVNQRHLLVEDVDLVVQLAAERYDALVGSPSPSPSGRGLG